jgi:hypothetical protein
MPFDLSAEPGLAGHADAERYPLMMHTGIPA